MTESVPRMKILLATEIVRIKKERQPLHENIRDSCLAALNAQLL